MLAAAKSRAAETHSERGKGPRMPRTFFGFYDLDASAGRGVSSDLATRLGAATQGDGFLQGCLYVRSDGGSVAIQMRYDGPDDWATHAPQGTLLQAADWRSRNGDGRSYRVVSRVGGDEDAHDAAFFAIQRFETPEGGQAKFADAIRAYYAEYALPIDGFVGGETFASDDGSRVLFLMAWEHEAALNALENRDGSLTAMQTYLHLATRHEYASYERISRLGEHGWERLSA